MKDPAQRTLRRAIPALFAVFALALAQTAFAADWTDANDPTVTYTALRSLKGANSGYVATDITPLSRLCPRTWEKPWGKPWGGRLKSV